MKTDEKLALLRRHIASFQRVVVAYSGGVDSTLLLKICQDTIGGKNVIAVTGISQTYTEEERDTARRISAGMGIEHVLLATDELANDAFADNPTNRCYHCKKELYAKIADLSRARGASAILDGTNKDDLSDYRPGRDAAQEYRVVSPFVIAEITKDEIRSLSRAYDLPTWDKPANPCLASRIPYGTRITDEILRRIENGERMLRALGFTKVRLRHHDDIARIEMDVSDFPISISVEMRRRLVDGLKALGYRWVCMDLEGYRTGSLNPAVTQAQATSPHKN